MAKDNKKEKQDSGQKIGPKDKDIHLNVVGVPKRNVNVKKTHPRLDNEEYQLYRISIDTKGKNKERKRRLSSLEPSPKRTKHRKSHRSNDDDESSSDESTAITSRPQKPKSFGGVKKPVKRGGVDSEICFTIPGEKGKAIRIVGSSTKPLDETSSRESSGQRVKRKNPDPSRQVGFARLDEVYGTTPEETSIESHSSLPYRRTPQQVYKMENNSPTSVFKDPTISKLIPERRFVRGNDEDKPVSPYLENKQSKPNLQSSRASPPLANNSKPAANMVPPGADSHKAEHEKPSTSRRIDAEEPESSPSKQSGPSRPRPVSSKNVEGKSSNEPSGYITTSNASFKYEPMFGNSKETKGKYPFYPYDKQKRSKSPMQIPEPGDVKREDKEAYVYHQLPSIPEVRSAEHSSIQVSDSETADVPPKETSKLSATLTTTKEVGKIISSTPPSTKRNSVPSNQPLMKKDESVPNDGRPVVRNPLNNKPTIGPNKSSTQIGNTSKSLASSSSITKDQKHDSSRLSLLTPANTRRDPLRKNQSLSGSLKPIQMRKSSLSTISNTQRGTLGTSPVLQGSPKSNEPKRVSRMCTSTSPMTSNTQRKSETPILNYNVQSTPSKLEPPNSNRNETQSKLQGLPTIIRSRNSQESAVTNSREPLFKRNQASVNNKTPTKRPETADKEVMTDKVLKPKEATTQGAKNEELNKSSPLSTKQSPQDSTKNIVSSLEKDSKRTKSKGMLSNFVSSIPKPSFRRNRSLEKKSTDKSIVSDQNKNKASLEDQNPSVAKEKVDVKDSAKRPVDESVTRKVHERVVEPYPGWVTSPEQEPAEKRENDSQPQGFKGGNTPISGKSAPMDYTKEFLPYGIDDSSSVEIANRSYGEHPLARKSSTAPKVSEQMKRSEVMDEEEEPPNYIGGQNKMGKDVDPVPQRRDIGAPKVSDQMKKSALADKEDEPPNYLANQNEMKEEVDLKSRIPQYSENNRQPLPDRDSNVSIQYDLDRMDDPGYNNFGKNKPPFDGIIAFPGRTYEQTPFGYESQYQADQNKENEALASLEDGFEANKRLKQDTNESPTHLVDKHSSLVSRSARSPGGESKKPFYGYPIQVMRGSTDSQLLPEKRTPKEVSYDRSKNSLPNDRVADYGKREDNESPVSKENTSRPGLGQTSTNVDGKETKTKPLKENPFGKTPEEQVYLGNVPDASYGVFHPGDRNDRQSPNADKSNPPTVERQGPSGILIFVNKKNETASPFGSSGPTRKGPKATKNPNDPKKKKKRKSSASGDTTLSSSMVSSISDASGDKLSESEVSSAMGRSLSGRQTTERFPCGCVRVITVDPRNELRREELVSVNCKDGSRCDVSKQNPLLFKSKDSSSVSWEGSRARSNRPFPDIEVIADGIVSKRPIPTRTPAPTMNGAALTGTFKIKSNKVNGICNFYLDRKLKNYLRNNIDKIKLLLEDDRR